MDPDSNEYGSETLPASIVLGILTRIPERSSLLCRGIALSLCPAPVVPSSVADPDPHRSGSFAWRSRSGIKVPDLDPAKKEKEDE